jgi:cell division protein ZapA
MAQVTVQIDGKAYRMACEAGQEGHLTELAANFDQYVHHLKGQFGEIGDLRLTVMAGIMVMDELSETGRKLKAAEAELETMKRNRDSMLATSEKTDELLVTALGELSGQIQGIASKLNGHVGAAE